MGIILGTIGVYAFLAFWIIGIIALNIGDVVDFDKIKRHFKK